MIIIDEVRKFVEEECKKPTNNYGMEAYESHFIPTVRYAKMLAENLNVDKEVIEIAAWLHDIGSIMVGRENHHVTGIEIAEKKLKELGYDKEKIEKVKKCVYSHRRSRDIKPEREEARVIVDADGMDSFDKLDGLFYAAFITEKQNTKEGRKSIRQKIINSFNKLSPDARKIVKSKYEAAMLLLGKKK